MVPTYQTSTAPSASLKRARRTPLQSHPPTPTHSTLYMSAYNATSSTYYHNVHNADAPRSIRARHACLSCTPSYQTSACLTGQNIWHAHDSVSMSSPTPPYHLPPLSPRSCNALVGVRLHYPRGRSTKSSEYAPHIHVQVAQIERHRMTPACTCGTSLAKIYGVGECLLTLHDRVRCAAQIRCREGLPGRRLGRAGLCGLQKARLGILCVDGGSSTGGSACRYTYDVRWTAGSCS